MFGSGPVAVTQSSDFAPVSSKECLDIQATIECGFNLKRVRDMTRTYSLVYVSGLGLTDLPCKKLPTKSTRGLLKPLDYFITTLIIETDECMH